MGSTEKSLITTSTWQTDIRNVSIWWVRFEASLELRKCNEQLNYVAIEITDEL